MFPFSKNNIKKVDESELSMGFVNMKGYDPEEEDEDFELDPDEDEEIGDDDDDFDSEVYCGGLL